MKMQKFKEEILPIIGSILGIAIPTILILISIHLKSLGY